VSTLDLVLPFDATEPGRPTVAGSCATARPGCSTMERTHPPHSFIEIERLGQVVVGAGVQALNAIAALARTR